VSEAHFTDRFSLAGQRVLVTGASQGLGQGLACAVAEAGAAVVGVARSDSGLAETAARVGGHGGRFEPMAADLTDMDALDELIERIWDSGAVTGVVHAAGLQVRKPATEITREDWRRVATLQSEVPFFLTTALARRQIAAGVAGSHLLVGSLTSWIGLPNIAPYAASKAGVLGLTRTLAVEWAAHRLRVNVICPGYFHTALTDDLLADPIRKEKTLGRIPMRRLGVADDLAGAAVFLLSPAASYITGTSINVDGGWLAA
jgi:2-deoxy-D-gluconate 3-dehydrogenase